MLGTQWAPSKWECASFSLGKSSHMISLFSISHSLSGNVLWDRHWPFWVGRSSIFLTFSYFWFISLSFSSTLWKMGLTSILFIQLVWGIFFFFCWVFVFSFCLGLSYVSFPRINFLFSDCFLKTITCSWFTDMICSFNFLRILLMALRWRKAASLPFLVVSLFLS